MASSPGFWHRRWYREGSTPINLPLRSAAVPPVEEIQGFFSSEGLAVLLISSNSAEVLVEAESVPRVDNYASLYHYSLHVEGDLVLLIRDDDADIDVSPIVELTCREEPEKRMPSLSP